MNANLTEIAFILDRSGSMGGCAEAAIAGFNQFLGDQKQTGTDARFTLVLFNDQYEVPCASIPLPEVTELDATTFVPRGSTALLDAIGQTIDDLGARLAAMAEADRPGQVIVAILTDGLENASHRCSWEDVSARIAHQRDVYKWVFLFLGANQDAIASAAQIGIGRHHSASYAADAAGVQASSASMSRKIRSIRRSSAGHHLSKEEDQALHMDMQSLADEEDRKARGSDKGGKKPK